MGVYRAEFGGNPNVGLLGYADEKVCLLGDWVPKGHFPKVEKALGVQAKRVRMCGTDLIGVFCAGNANALLVPGIIFESEFERLKALGMNPVMLETDMTALGNTILASDRGAVVSPEFPEKIIKQIADALAVPVAKGTIGGLDNVGALACHNGKVCVISPEATAEERVLIEKMLGMRTEPATANMGTPYLRAAVVANRKGMVVGSACSGVEIAAIDDAFSER